MTIVEPLTPYTCTLACLESYFADFDRSQTQSRFLVEERDILIRALSVENGRPKIEHFGAMGLPSLIELSQKLRLRTAVISIGDLAAVDKVIEELSAATTVFLFGSGAWSGGNTHCVRFSRVIESGKYEIFDPSFPKAQLREVAYKELEPKTSVLLQLERLA